MFQLKEQMKRMYRTILWLAFIKSNETSSAAKFFDEKQNGRKMIILHEQSRRSFTMKLDDFDPGYHLYDYYEWIFA